MGFIFFMMLMVSRVASFCSGSSDALKDSILFLIMFSRFVSGYIFEISPSKLLLYFTYFNSEDAL